LCPHVDERCSQGKRGVAGLVALTAAQSFAPTGARIEPSGFATIERAPSAPGVRTPREPHLSEAGWYARDVGISEAEAAKRQREHEAIRPELDRLVAELRRMEAGNFTAPRMVHKPDRAFELYFKRDPAATLARYTSNPRFRPALARYTREELEALVKPWTQRFEAHRLTGGWGSDDTHGTAEILMVATEEEYCAIAAREGWGPLPDAIKLEFASPLPFPPVQERARPFVRYFAQADRSTGIQLTGAVSGRIYLRDGCILVSTGKRRPRLAFFHRETGLGIDEAGYLALINRGTGKPAGRLGEEFTSAGPNAIDESWPWVRELRARCRSGEILNIGNPEGSAAFNARWR
jgi:hypothetical protein